MPEGEVSVRSKDELDDSPERGISCLEPANGYGAFLSKEDSVPAPRRETDPGCAELTINMFLNHDGSGSKTPI